MLELRREISRMEGELDGLLHARRLIADKDDLSPPTLLSEADFNPNKRERELSPQWKSILVNVFLRQLPNPVSIDEAMSYIHMMGWGINRNAVRSQLHLYAQRGLLKRMGDGLYRATDAIKPFCE